MALGLPLNCCRPCTTAADDDGCAQNFILQHGAGQRQVASSKMREAFLHTYRSCGTSAAATAGSGVALQQHALLPAVANYTATPLWHYVLQHGRRIMSLSTFQPGLYYYELPGIGYLAYALMTNGPDFLNLLSPVALSDPICAPLHYATIARAFIGQHPNAMFMQISGEFAEVLHRECGLRINNIGGETELDLASFSFSGYAKRGLRSAIAGAVKEGVRVEEVMTTSPCSAGLGCKPAGSSSSKAAASGSSTCSGLQSDIERSSTSSSCSSSSRGSCGNGTIKAGAAAHPGGPAAPARVATRALPAANWEALAAEMRLVDAAWVAHKGQNAARVWFLNRLPVLAPEPGVRKLVARDASGTMVGFIFFDAVYEAGQVVGYYANVTRMNPDAHPGVLNLLVKEFLDILRAENQLAGPPRKLSMKKSQRNKAGAAAAVEHATDTTYGSSNSVAAAAATAAAAPAGRVRFVSLGLSPLYQIDDSRFPHSKRLHRMLQLFHRTGSAFYPFKSLAAAKAKYGGGLREGRYEDPAVTWRPAYLAHSHKAAANVALFDLGKLVGFWEDPLSAASTFAGHQLGVAAAKLLHKLQRNTGKNGTAAHGKQATEQQQQQQRTKPVQAKQHAATAVAGTAAIAAKTAPSSKVKRGAAGPKAAPATAATTATEARAKPRSSGRPPAAIKPPTLLQLQADARFASATTTTSTTSSSSSVDALIPAASCDPACTSNSLCSSSNSGRMSSSSNSSSSGDSSSSSSSSSSSPVSTLSSDSGGAALQRNSDDSFYSIGSS